MSQTLSAGSYVPSSLVAEPALQRLRATITVGLPNGTRLLALRRVEAAIDSVDTRAQELLTASAPAQVDCALGSIAAATWRALEVAVEGNPATRFQQLQASWSSCKMPVEQRPLFERFMLAA